MTEPRLIGEIAAEEATRLGALEAARRLSKAEIVVNPGGKVGFRYSQCIRSLNDFVVEVELAYGSGGANHPAITALYALADLARDELAEAAEWMSLSEINDPRMAQR